MAVDDAAAGGAATGHHEPAALCGGVDAGIARDAAGADDQRDAVAGFEIADDIPLLDLFRAAGVQIRGAGDDGAADQLEQASTANVRAADRAARFDDQRSRHVGLAGGIATLQNIHYPAGADNGVLHLPARQNFERHAAANPVVAQRST
jgi:hypothetical protein